MADAADKVVADDERAMAQLNEQLRQQRIQESLNGYDPTRPVNCADCAAPVPPERLRAFPHTRRCVSCAAAVERRYAEARR